jgi:hypothetical protein
MYHSLKKQYELCNNSDVNIVVNLSNRPLTKIETAVLNKGLGFCITSNRPNNYCIQVDKEIDSIIRTLQIKTMFKDNNESKIEKFTSNPDWQVPPWNRNASLDGFSVFLKENVKRLVKLNKTKQNISAAERKALDVLRKDKSILINKADKGGSIVVMNTCDYECKMEKMLSDVTTYTITKNIDLEHAKQEVDELYDYLFNANFISKRQHKHFLRNKPKMPVLYGLGKIHKTNCPLRPIVSQINSPTYELSKYLDYLLTTAEKSISNLLQDTTRFLQYIKLLPQVSESTLLFTIDVTSLYTVLPHDMCIEYVCELYNESLNDWNRYTPELKPVPCYVIAQILRIILSQTFFKFNATLYTQQLGITMGSSCSVKVANITLHKHLLNTLKYYTGTLPNVSLRLIDDIFGTFDGTLAELLEFVEFLNNSHQTIKFTVEHSKTAISFLDTMVYIDKKCIKTKLYKKPTDNKQYLHFNSEHPQHMKKSIPYAQALRYRRIIEDDYIFKLELEKLATNFIVRQYPENIVQNAIDKVDALKRDDLLRYKVKTAEVWNNTACVLTFNNALVNNRDNNIYKLFTAAWSDLIVTAPELCDINMPKIVFKKCQTINSLLVSTIFPPIRWSENPTINKSNNIVSTNAMIVPYALTLYNCTRCTQTRCKTCDNLSECHDFRSTTFDVYFPLHCNMNCAVENVIYLITCVLCELQYVGETGGCLRDRMTAHRSCVKLRKPTPVGIHFTSEGHKQHHMKIVPIEQVLINSLPLRRKRELYWQLKLGTIFPRGLNAYPVLIPEFRSVKITTASDLSILWAAYNTIDSD